MGFASYDDLISEITVSGKRLILPWTKNATTAPAAATWYSMWPVGGQPGSGTWVANNLTFNRTTDATAGALYHGGNKSTDTKHLLYMMALASAGAPPPLLMLVDQVGYYGPISQSASLQTLTNTNAPDRYTTSQSGLQACLVCTAVGGATASNITALSYTNQAGTAGQAMPTGTAVAVTVSAAAPTATLGARVVTTVAGPFLPLAAGDSGMNSIQTITFSAANTGSYAIHMVKPLSYIALSSANVPSEKDLVMQVANLERVYDGACLSWLAYFPAATGATLMGQVDVAWG